MMLRDALKSYRINQGITARALAHALEMSPQFLCDIELGKRNLTDERILKLPPGLLRNTLLQARASEYQYRAQKLLRMPRT
jgi:transcriptional regulator with XRE-family HTH domain